MIRIACSHPDCGKTFRVAESVAGRNVTCKSCGRDFVAQPVAQETVAPQARDTSADMSTPAAWVKDAALLSRIGRFEVRKKLGQGGFGTVYRAFDPQLERDVAVKVPKTELLASPESEKRFLREAKAAARLNHPHIVPVYDAGRDGELNYIASAFIDGQPLAALIEPLAGDFRRIATLIRQLAEALDYAHSQGVIHRDVKPDNVMIDSAGQPHLMDFGLARIGDAAQKLTHDGTVMGTPAYMSPEQACDDPSAVTHASDQYSLGVVLYELLTGDTPFSGAPAIIIFNTLNQPIPPPRSLRADLPLDLETICLKAMDKEPQQRYATCQKMAEDLGRWFNAEPILARRITLAERFARWTRRNPIVAALSAAILLVLTSGFVIMTLLWNRSEQHYQDLLTEKKTSEQLRGNVSTVESRATVAETTASSATRAAQREHYLRSIRFAAQELEAKNPADAARFLSACDAADRHWEWSLLSALVVNKSVQTAGVDQVFFTQDATQIVTTMRWGGLSIWNAETLYPVYREGWAYNPKSIDPVFDQKHNALFAFSLGGRLNRFDLNRRVGEAVSPFEHWNGVATNMTGDRIISRSTNLELNVADSLGRKISQHKLPFESPIIHVNAAGTAVFIHGQQAADGTQPRAAVIDLQSGSTVELSKPPLQNKTTAPPLTRLSLQTPQFDQSGHRVAAFDAVSQMIYVWNASDGRIVANLGPWSAPTCVTFSPDLETLAVGCYQPLIASTGKRSLSIWDLSSQQMIAESGPAVSAVAYSPSGHLIATGERFDSGLSQLRLRPTQLGNWCREHSVVDLTTEQKKAVDLVDPWDKRQVAIRFPSGIPELIWSDNRDPNLWFRKNGGDRNYRFFRVHNGPSQFAVSCDGQQCAAITRSLPNDVYIATIGSGDQRISTLASQGATNVVAGDPYTLFVAKHVKAVQAVAIASGTVTTVDVDGEIHLWSTRMSSEPLQTMKTGLKYARIAMDESSEFVALGSPYTPFSDVRNVEIQIWDLKKRKRHETFTVPGNSADGLAFLPHSNGVVAWGGFGAVLRRVTDKSVTLGGAGGVTCTAFTSDGRRAFLGKTDGAIVIVDLDQNEMLMKLPGKSPVLALAMSDDDSQLVSMHKDGVMRRWFAPEIEEYVGRETSVK